MNDKPAEMRRPAHLQQPANSSPRHSGSRNGGGLQRLPRRFAVWHRRHPCCAGLAIFALSLLASSVGNYLSYWIFLTSDGWAIYWPYDGIVVAILLLTKRRYWHWILGGFFCIFARGEYQAGEPFAEVAVDLFSNLTEILLVSICLPPFRTLNQWIMEPRMSVRFPTFAILLGAALASLPVAWYFRATTGSGFWYLAAKWGFADAVGNALWIPLVLILFSPATYALFRLRALPVTLSLLGIVIGSTWFSFDQGLYPVVFVPYPMLLFAALRLGFPGAVLGANMLSLIASYQSLHGKGPFFAVTHSWTYQQTVLLQAYSMFAMLFVMPLSVMRLERLNFEDMLQRALADMKKLATVDQLTGVANRRQFDQTLHMEWNRALRDHKSLTILMIDADHFKAYNDTYGHIAGDRCLQQIAKSLQGAQRRPHDLVARYGGEEFATILPGAPVDIAIEVAQQMRLQVFTCDIPHQRNPPGRVTVSIGCASIVPQANTTSEDLLAAADKALYAAKESGRNRVCSEPAAPSSERYIQSA